MKLPPSKRRVWRDTKVWKINFSTRKHYDHFNTLRSRYIHYLGVIGVYLKQSFTRLSRRIRFAGGPKPVSTLKQAIASGLINRDQISPTLPQPTGDINAPGGLSGSVLIDSKTLKPIIAPPVFRTPERQAKLDAMFGTLPQVTFAGKPMDQIVPPPIGDNLGPVDVEVGKPVMAADLRSLKIAGVQLDDEVPIPDFGKKYSMVMQAMQIGQSFKIDESVKKSSISLLFKKNAERGFTCAKEGDGWRIWRLS